MLRCYVHTDARETVQCVFFGSLRFAARIMSKRDFFCLACAKQHRLSANQWYKLYSVTAGAAECVSEQDGCGYAFRASPSDGEPWLRADILLTFKGQRPTPAPATRTEVGWVCSRQYQARPRSFAN